MRVSVNLERPTRARLSALLEGLTALNYVLMGELQLPPLYQSGVRYQREEDGREEWQNAAETYQLGFGDCEDLAAYRAAELRRAGIPARAIAVRTGRRMYHAVVAWPDGTIEDPSRRLGMKGRQ